MKNQWKYPFVFTGIPGLIIDRYMREWDGNDIKTYLALARFTWGRGKKADTIAGPQLMEITGLPRTSLYDSLKKLKDQGHITSEGPPRHPKTFRLNYPPIHVFASPSLGTREKASSPSGRTTVVPH